jgi:hypothetical protein
MRSFVRPGFIFLVSYSFLLFIQANDWILHTLLIYRYLHIDVFLVSVNNVGLCVKKLWPEEYYSCLTKILPLC